MGFWGYSPSMKGHLCEWFDDTLNIFPQKSKHFVFGFCPCYISLLYLLSISPFYMPSPICLLHSTFYLFSRNLKNKIEETQEAARRAESLPLLLCHGKGIMCGHNHMRCATLGILYCSPVIPVMIRAHCFFTCDTHCTRAVCILVVTLDLLVLSAILCLGYSISWSYAYIFCIR